MNTSEIIKKAKLIEIKTRKKVNELFIGSYHSSFKGQGLEFDEFKEYEYGDDVKNIDWKVSARLNKPYVKKFIEERELTLMLVVDTSSSMQGALGGIKKIDIASEIVSILGFSAIKNQDKVGLLLFNHDDLKFISPKKGKAHILRLIRETFYTDFFKKDKTPSDVFKFLINILKRKSIVIFISDFLFKIDENALKYIKVLNSKHDVRFIILKEDYDLINKIKDKFIVIKERDIENNSLNFYNILDMKKTIKDIEDHLFNLKQILKKINIRYVSIQTDIDYTESLIKLFK